LPVAMRVATILLSAVVAAQATELTKETWDSAVAGKTVFVKFFAPWCGHCKRMKPDWDKLMAEFKDSPDRLIADVDCTAGGKDLCNENGVRGFPSLKFGDPNNLEEYKGGRDYAALKKHAEGLGPQCGPANLDLCDAEKKAKIQEYQKMSVADREAKIKHNDEEAQKLEADFKDFVDKLQKQYSEASEKKDKDVEAIKSSGLGLLKAVHAHAKSAKSEL
jgi:protein disulfide-isomerase-like protein